MNKIPLYILSFFFYSAAGWFVESLYRSIGEKRIINSGFLTGPMCPIYGTGALVMTVFLYNPFKDRPLLVFLLGMVLCDIVEYITSVLMEVLFHARWWDYTYEFLNIKGRICLKHTLYWGIVAISFVKLIHPHVDAVMMNLDVKTVRLILIGIFVVFFIDVANSVRKALDIRKLQVKLSSILNSIGNTFNSVKTTFGSKKNSFQQSLENTADKLSDTKDEVFEQLQDVIHEFELRLSKGTRDKKDKNKYSSRFFRNNFSIEKSIRKQLERIQKLRDDIKSNLNEDGEKQ
mgnify:FL=1